MKILSYMKQVRGVKRFGDLCSRVLHCLGPNELFKVKRLIPQLLEMAIYHCGSNSLFDFNHSNGSAFIKTSSALAK